MYGQRRTSGSRYNSYHGAKSGLIGHGASQVSPAWRGTPHVTAHSSGNDMVGARSKTATEQLGSKILMSKLPLDVGEIELEV